MTIVPRVQLLIVLASLAWLSASPASAQTRGWGSNSNGQLGIGNGADQPSPVTLSGSADDVTGVSGGGSHTLFLKANGTVHAAGQNDDGQLGDATTNTRTTPTPVMGVSNAVAISAGQLHSLALLADGTVVGWGRTYEGQLGGGGDACNPSAGNCLTAGPIPGLSGIVAIDAGWRHSLALAANGTVYAWGGNSNGQIGNGTLGSPEPCLCQPVVQVGAGVPGFTDIVDIAGGATHSIALKSDGSAWIWGDNAHGTRGDGTAGGDQLLPVQNTNIGGVAQIAAGYNFNVALKPDGSVFAWGFNVRGNVGNGTAGWEAVLSPAQTAISDVIDIEAAGIHTLARKSDGSIWGWGWNQHGELGIGVADGWPSACECRSTPVQANVGAGIPVFGVGASHSFSATPAIDTPTGSSVALRGHDVSLSFDSVLDQGTTSFTAMDPNSSGLDAGGFAIVSNSAAYSIDTTAAHSGHITVCLRVDNVSDAAVFNRLALLHGEGPDLVDRTVSRDYAAREVCAQVTSLSPFVLAQPQSSAGSVQFAASDAGVGESAGAASITVTRTDGDAGAVSVEYSTGDGTATGGAGCGAGVDYGAASGTLNWAAGDSADKTFTVSACEDAADEGDETVTLALGNPGGGAALGLSAATLTISDDDAAPSGVTLTVSPSTIDEGQSATLQWTSENAAACTASGSWSGTKALTGAETVTPAGGAYSYVLECEGAGGSASATASLFVRDTTPDPFAFASVRGAPRRTLVTSESITVSGVNSAAPISVTGGTYSVDRGAFTSGPGTVTSGQVVRVQVMSAKKRCTTTSATLTVGGADGAFKVTTGHRGLRRDHRPARARSRHPAATTAGHHTRGEDSMKNKKNIGTGLAVVGAVGLAGAAQAAGPPQRIGLVPADSGHWQAGAGLPEATGEAGQALVRVVDGSDAHPEAAAIRGLRGEDTGDVDRLGFTVAGDEAGIVPCIKVAFTDALGNRQEAMITSRMMRGRPGRETGWTQYSFDAGLPPGGRIEAIELGAHVEVDPPDTADPPDTRPTLRFDDVIVNDEVFTGPADNATIDTPDT